MSLTVVLDSGPLGLVTNPRRTPEVIACEEWIAAVSAAGFAVIVPAIADYEVRRELLRARRTNGLRRLDTFLTAEPDRYLPISIEAMRLAAELWATARQRGKPTAPDLALDGDVILAAQALTLGLPEANVIVATTNTAHLTEFVHAELWQNIPVAAEE